jgi:glutaminyl-tRNA synthetase
VNPPPQPKAEPRERPPKPPALAARMNRYIHAYGLSEDEADRLTTDSELADFFEATIAAHPNEHAASNWIVNELLGALKDQPLSDLPFDAAAFGALIALVDDKTISRRIAKDVFAEMLENGGNPRTIVDRRGLRQVTDTDALGPVVAKVVAAHPDKVAEYHDGKTGLIGFFVGQVMRETNGKANPKLVKELLEKRLAK